MDEDSRYLCTKCYGGTVPIARIKIGYSTCLPCGEQEAKVKASRRTIAPINKSNYMLITDPDQLKQLNPKRTQA